MVSCIINLFAGSIYAWSVFASPLAERIGSLLQTSLTSADLAIAFSIANALGPIPMIFGGLINDRFGPKFVIAAGGISMGFGLYGLRKRGKRVRADRVLWSLSSAQVSALSMAVRSTIR